MTRTPYYHSLNNPVSQLPVQPQSQQHVNHYEPKKLEYSAPNDGTTTFEIMASNKKSNIQHSQAHRHNLLTVQQSRSIESILNESTAGKQILLDSIFQKFFGQIERKT